MEAKEKKSLEEMLKGLKASLEVFRNANDRESIYEAKGHIRRIEARLEAKIYFSGQRIGREKGDDCGDETCQKCCAHSDERDHGICIDCGHEEDPGLAIDRAMGSWENK